MQDCQNRVMKQDPSTRFARSGFRLRARTPAMRLKLPKIGDCNSLRDIEREKALLGRAQPAVTHRFTSHTPGWRGVTWGVGGVEWHETAGGEGCSKVCELVALASHGIAPSGAQFGNDAYPRTRL